jgi:hypothetical protein
MKESYRKGVANHPGLESCGGDREAALEALTEGTCRLGIELRKGPTIRGEADGVTKAGRQQGGVR